MLTIQDKVQLRAGADELGVLLDETAISRFDAYAARLYEVNKHLNLTRVPPEAVVPLHFLDSLALCRAVKLHCDSSLLDVGTGAGLPGLAVAVAYPWLCAVLMDGTRKRLEFVAKLVQELDLKNVSVQHGRAEEKDSSHLHRSFSTVTARAVAPMVKLAAWLPPFVRPGGNAVAYKSENARQEIEKSRSIIETQSCSLDRIVEVRIPGTDIVRLLAVMEVRSR